MPRTHRLSFTVPSLATPGMGYSYPSTKNPDRLGAAPRRSALRAHTHTSVKTGAGASVRWDHARAPYML